MQALHGNRKLREPAAQVNRIVLKIAKLEVESTPRVEEIENVGLRPLRPPQQSQALPRAGREAKASPPSLALPGLDYFTLAKIITIV